MDIKRGALTTLHYTGALALARYLRRHALAVVTYHGVLPGDDDGDAFLLGNFVAASAFTWQMAWLVRHCTPVGLDAVVRSMETGQPLPPRSVVVTFDDGFANNFRYAFPILRRYGVPATIFLATGHIGVPGAQLWTERVKRAVFLSPRDRLPAIVPGQQERSLAGAAERAAAARDVLGRLKRMAPDLRDPYLREIEAVCGRPALGPADADRYDFLTWDEVRVMARDGITFGSHTVSHPIVSTLTDQDLERELRDSKATLEAELQHECTTFAYPNGHVEDFGAREKRALAGSGYRAALSLHGGVNTRIVDPFDIDRVNVTRGYYPALFSASLTGVLDLGRRMRERMRGAGAASEGGTSPRA